MTNMLPAEFKALEPYAPIWALPTERQRYDQRLARPMEDLESFYAAIFPRAKEAMDYLDQFDINNLNHEQRNLFYMLCALSTISFAVDCFKQQKMPDSGSAYLDMIVEPAL